MNKKFTKHEILKNIFVYKGLFTDVKNTLSVIKDSENQEKEIYIKDWWEWSDLGSMSKSDPNNFYSINTDKLDEKSLNEHIVLKEIYDIYKFVAEDYLKNNFNNVDWEYGVSTPDLSHPMWSLGEISILKHRGKPHNGNQMSYHTDEHQWDKDVPGKKFALTVTMYLEDEHVGGEVSFFNEKDSNISLINFHPAPGDITVFPSFYPYYHGVLPLKSGEKYLIRMFFYWYFPGGKEWIENRMSHSKEEWEQMELKRKSDEFNSGKYSRHISIIGEPEITDQTSVPVHIKKESVTFLNGKDLV